MRRISTLTLAAALLGSGAVAGFAAPAIAKDKKADAAAGPKLSPDFVKVAKPAQDALQAKNYAGAEPLVAQTEAAAKTDYEKYVATAMRYDLENGKLYAAQDANPKAAVNETALAAPLDALIANPTTPADAKPKYAYRRGALAFNSKQYPQAITYFQQAKQLGYTDPQLDLLIVKAKMESGDVAGGSADLDAAIAKAQASGQKPPEDYYRYAIAKSNATGNKQQTVGWLVKYGNAYGTPVVWHDVLVTYGLVAKPVDVLDKGQKVDVFRLMRASKGLADQGEYEQFAQYLIDRGLQDEAVSVVKEGQATGKLPAGNKAAADLLAQAAEKSKLEGSIAAQETKARAAASGQLAASIGDVYAGKGNYAKAIELYQLALTKGGANADEVNLHLGIAKAMSGDKAGAATAFKAVSGQPRANIAQLWTGWATQTGAAA